MSSPPALDLTSDWSNRCPKGISLAERSTSSCCHWSVVLELSPRFCAAVWGSSRGLAEREEGGYQRKDRKRLIGGEGQLKNRGTDRASGRKRSRKAVEAEGKGREQEGLPHPEKLVLTVPGRTCGKVNSPGTGRVLSVVNPHGTPGRWAHRKLRCATTDFMGGFWD